ncbi:MAG TPA: Gfo/Idh/MocA family oxidoreductase [Terracidiphilus sp.]|nr:Gfo/Idh/MocA family oxidoreductase [Terracidiphilus sp.]
MTSSNSESRLIRWGVAGPGRAAARFAQGMQAVPGAELTAVWGRTPIKASQFAARFHVPQVCPSLSALLDCNIDAVYVATHPDSHAVLCTQALAAGKHVMCEKPSAMNARELENILAAAQTHGRLFMEAMKPPFFPLYRRLRQHLQSDPIGEIGLVRAGHADSSLPPDYPLHFPELAGGGIMGIGPYEAFLAIEWLGPFRRVQVMGRVNPAGVDTLALFQTEHERGMAQLHTGLDLLSRGDALLCGPQGYVTIHEHWWNPLRATVNYLDGRIIQLEEPFVAGGFNYETEHFCQLLRTGQSESPVIPHSLSLGMARLLEDTRKALGVRFPGEA